MIPVRLNSRTVALDPFLRSVRPTAASADTIVVHVATEAAVSDPRAIPGAVRDAARDAVEAARPRLRGWLHAATSPIALAAGIVLVVLAPTSLATAAAAAFAATSFVL